MAGGLLLIAAALLLTCVNLGEEIKAGKAAQAVLEQLAPQMPAISAPMSDTAIIQPELPEYVLHPEMEMPVIQIDGENYIGVIELPTLELSLPVMEQWSYLRLNAAPCRYQGSVYMNDLIIMAHNFNTHFGGIKNLRPGDEVDFVDGDGNLFRYEVAELETLDSYDVEEMAAGDWDLTLFTCTIGGRSRVTVRCVLAAG